MNPYTVLGVPQGADAATIKKAYYELVKKYHPDKYADNPLKELAEEKLKEVNEAYDMLTGGSSAKGSSYSSGHSYSGASYQYTDVRNLIAQGKLDEAESLLRQKDSSSAEYHYLMGMIAMKRGFFDDAVSHFDFAVSADPSNAEYRFARNNINNRNNSYRQYTPNSSSSGCSSPCDCCTSLICADCCCECMGSDLISCC